MENAEIARGMTVVGGSLVRRAVERRNDDAGFGPFSYGPALAGEMHRAEAVRMCDIRAARSEPSVILWSA